MRPNLQGNGLLMAFTAQKVFLKDVLVNISDQVNNSLQVVEREGEGFNSWSQHLKVVLVLNIPSCEEFHLLFGSILPTNMFSDAEDCRAIITFLSFQDSRHILYR